MYLNRFFIWLRGIPPPLSLILMVMSTSVLDTKALMGGRGVSGSGKFSTVALMLFLITSNSMWCRWDWT